MNMIRHEMVCRWGNGIMIGIDAPKWAFGLKTHDWGIRLMFWRWDFCINLRDHKADARQQKAAVGSPAA